MDLNSIMPLLSNFLKKDNTNTQSNEHTKNFSNTYPDTTFDGQKINTMKNTEIKSPPSNNILQSLLPILNNGGNLDLSSITNLLGKNSSNTLSGLFTPKNNKKTNPPEICEFVKVDDYEL